MLRVYYLRFFLLFCISKIDNQIYQGEPCFAPFCRNEGSCIDNPMSNQGYNCICTHGSYGETCDRHYLTCYEGTKQMPTSCLPSDLEKSFMHRDVCYKLVSLNYAYKGYAEYCLEHGMIPALVKKNETLNYLKKFFPINEPVFIGFHSENFITTWYDGTPVRLDSSVTSKIQCGILNINRELISLANCFTPRKFICQKNIDCQNKSIIDYKSPCTPNPCVNDGVCFQKNINTYECICNLIYGGTRCAHEIVLVEGNKMCNIAGFIYYNQNCYKLFKVKLLDFNWIETACFDEESSLIEEIDSTSADEILFLASLIVDIVTTDLNCIATKIKRTAPNIDSILKNLTLDKRIHYSYTTEGANDILFICVSDVVKSLAAYLQFRDFDDNNPEELFFVCKEIKIKIDNETITKPLCPTPELGRNAFVNYNITSGITLYSCYDNMYPILNTNSKLQCLGPNSWSGRPLECEYSRCILPPINFENAIAIRGLNSTAITLYDCLEEANSLKNASGYSFLTRCITLNDSNNYYTKWNGSNICIEKKMCPHPYDILNGKVALIKDQGIVIYTCDSKSTNQSELKYIGNCTNQGQWNITAPECKVIRCGYPNLIQNAVMYLSSFETGSKVSYNCIRKFRPFYTENFSTCSNDMIWTPINFRCIEITCETNIQFKNAQINYSGNKENDLAVINCNMGYKINFNRVHFTCLNSSWKISEDFKLECEFLSCPRPIIANKFLIANVNVSKDFKHFEKIEFECVSNYEIEGDSTVTCLPDGTWSSSFPTCKKILCETAPVFQNTLSNYSNDLAIGDFISYTCRPGYEMAIPENETSVAFYCTKKAKWFGLSQIRCSNFELKCDIPETLENGFVVYDGLKINSKASYKCNMNFTLIGNQTRICLRNGKWSDVRPSCFPYKCPMLENIPKGKLDYDDYSAVYQCDRGYELIGSSERFCMPTLKWFGITPKCSMLQCSELENLEYGQLIINGYELNNTVLYLCNSGYDMVDGTKTRTCLFNQKWTGKAPTCKKISFILNRRYLNEKKLQIKIVTVKTKTKRQAEIKASEVPWSFYDDEIYFYEKPNEYLLFSCENSSITSQTKEVLVKTKDDLDKLGLLKCDSIECESSLNKTSENVLTLNYTGQKYGNYISFGCKIGYNINDGSSTRICQQNGKWSGQSPTCSLIYCGMPKNGKNSFWKFGETPTVAYYYCNKGFKENEGDKIRSCSVDSTDQKIKWKGIPLSCSDLYCDKLNLTNSTADVSSYVFGSIAYLQCKSGYRAVKGNFIRTCSETGSWSGEELICYSIAEFIEKYREKYSMKIYSSKAFGGIAIGFIVCLFLTTCIVDFRWSLLLVLYYKIRPPKGGTNSEMVQKRNLAKARALKKEKFPKKRSSFFLVRRSTLLPAKSIRKASKKSKRSISNKNSIFAKNNSIKPIDEEETNDMTIITNDAGEQVKDKIDLLEDNYEFKKNSTEIN